MEQGRVFVVAGPSGAGKSTLINKALKKVDGVYFSVSATTRDRRKGEVDGRDYHFLTGQQFDDRVERDEFLEWEEVFGERYGTLKSEVERAAASGSDVLLDLDVKGALNVKLKMREALLIFILPPTFKDLDSRLRNRKRDAEEEIKSRTETAPWEMQLGKAGFDVFLVNNDVDAAARVLASILRGEKT